jgi:hypothetical protein
LNKKIINEFYLMALKDLANGSPIQELEKAISYYEVLEDYEACAGIQRAIDEVKNDTLTTIKKKIHELKSDKRSS